MKDLRRILLMVLLLTATTIGLGRQHFKHVSVHVKADHRSQLEPDGHLTVASSATVSIPSLFDTGTVGPESSGALQNDTFIDTHYSLIASTDPAFPGPDSIVVNQSLSPFPPNCPVACWLATGPLSKWIAPRADASSGDTPGISTYRTAFDLTGFDPSSAVISGQWSAADFGQDILVNGVSTGLSFTEENAFMTFHPFVISRGFVAGVNTIDFVVLNLGGPTGLRVEMKGTAQAVAIPPPSPATPELIPVQPASEWTLISGPPNPPGCINPIMTGIVDVDTPSGPGVQADAIGNTLECCGCASARGTFQLSMARSSVGATLSFYYQTAITGQYSGTSYILDFRHQDASVGTISLLGLLGPAGESNCNVTQATSPNQQNVVINLGAYLGNVVFDGVDVVLENYGCISTNDQIISVMTLDAGSPQTPAPVITSLAADLNGDVLTMAGQSFDPFNPVTEVQVFLLDPSGKTVGSTNPFPSNFPDIANVNFTLTVTGLNQIPSALEAEVVLIDALGNVSSPVIVSFSQGDPGGPPLFSASYNEITEVMVLKGQILSFPEVEVDGVIVSPPALAKIKGGGAKLKVIGSRSSLNLTPGINRVRVIINGLRSNIVMVSS
jgi:hypothetical protein